MIRTKAWIQKGTAVPFGSSFYYNIYIDYIMKCLVLGSGRFANMGHKVVSLSRYTPVSSGSGNAGHGAYVKKDLVILDEGKSSEGAGIKRKLKPLKFKM